MAHPSSRDIVDLYDRNASHWNADRGTTLIEQSWLDRFIDVSPRGASVLDIGCGSGEPIARYLVSRGCRIAGVDSSPGMIAICEAKHPDQRWIVADMRELALGETFDGLLAWDSFFHLTPEDQRAMFAVFAAHARAGSALMFTSGPRDGEAIGSWRGAPLYHASLAPEEYRALLASSGFEVVSHVAEDPACGGHTVWLARRVA